MLRPDFTTGLALAALVLDARRGTTSLDGELAAALEARLAAVASHASREAALATLARAAAAQPPEALPESPRAAALLAPHVSPLARARAVALPVPRRGYRPPPGLREHLLRLAGRESPAARAEAERTRVRGRPWPE